MVLLFLSGCATNAEDTAGASPPAPTRSSRGFECPAGLTWRLGADVCAAVLGGPKMELGEPVIAIDGRDHIAIASVANITLVQEPLDELVPALPGGDGGRPPCRGFAVCLFTTRDGGETWANTTLPAAGQYFDPQILFTKSGRLVVVTLGYGQGTSTHIAVTSTTDDGFTWTPTVTASTNDRVDRPWLRAGLHGLALLYVADSGREVRGAVSKDEGATWSAAGTLTCRWPSPPVEVSAGSWVFLCSHYVDGRLLTRAFGWDRASATFEPRGSMPLSRWFPIVTKDGQGGLVAVTSHDDVGGEASITVRSSRDQGASWGPAFDLRKASEDLHAMRYSCLMAADLHSDGTLRVIVAGIESVSQQAQLCLPRETRRFIWAVDVEPTTGAVIATRPLGSPNDSPPVRSSETAPVNDDFHAIADGAMAWSHDGIVAWTRLP